MTEIHRHPYGFGDPGCLEAEPSSANPSDDVTLGSLARADALGDLARSLLHELAQPLNAAGFYAGTGLSMLQDGNADPEKLARVLGGVDRQVRRAAELLQRLRDFLRQGEVQPRPVAIHDVLDGALALTRHLAAEHGVQVIVGPCPQGVRVVADALQIEQVLFNLIRNIIRAMGGDPVSGPGKEIRVSAKAIDGALLASVRPGRASAPGDRDGLRVAPRPPGEPDLGPELALCRKIVEAHGGRLWAEAVDSAGSALHFTLPLA